MIKEYDIERSPLYRLRSKRKLAILLKLPEKYFNTIHIYKYSEFYENKSDGEKRKINNPENKLKVIQRRLLKLLNRISKPDWLISGKKKKSYVDNAKAHMLQQNVCTMDIEKFYDSTKEFYVYNFFKYGMKMSTDVAKILTSLVTYNGRIPTGTPTSQIIAFLTYNDIFMKIHKLCEDNEIVFTLYVDDITLSSNTLINRDIKQKINSLLNKKGLNIKNSKTKFYSKKSKKSVTGTIINGNSIMLENRKRKEIIELYKECVNPATYSVEKLVKLKGKMSDARQVEKDIFPTICNYLNKHSEEIKKYNSTFCKKQSVGYF